MVDFEMECLVHNQRLGKVSVGPDLLISPLHLFEVQKIPLAYIGCGSLRGHTFERQPKFRDLIQVFQRQCGYDYGFRPRKLKGAFSNETGDSFPRRSETHLGRISNRACRDPFPRLHRARHDRDAQTVVNVLRKSLVSRDRIESGNAHPISLNSATARDGSSIMVLIVIATRYIKLQH